ncbi:cell division protein ZipA [Paraglaciecola aestuariivivens]
MEAEGLRWSLLVIGSVVIAGLAVHGIWVSRKNNEKRARAAKPSQLSEQDYAMDNEATDRFSSESAYSDQGLEQDWSMDSFTAKQDPVIDEQDLSLDSATTKFEKEKPANQATDLDHSHNDFDDLGLGAVRVVSNSSSAQPQDKSTEENNPVTASSSQPASQAKPDSEVTGQSPVKPSSGKVYASVVTQPKPEFAAKYQSLAAETVAISQQERGAAANHKIKAKVSSSDDNAAALAGVSNLDNHQAPEPPPFLLKKDPEIEAAALKSQDKPKYISHETPVEEPTVVSSAPSPELATEDSNLAEKLTLAEQARNLVKRKKVETVKKRREPKLAEDQLAINFDDIPEPDTQLQAEAQPEKSPQTSQTQASSEAAQEQTQEQPQEVLVLNVKVAEGQSIAGAALLPMLLTLGFKFGDQDIFHRHVNSNGKGPVLFSLANMFKPGNFDIDNLENFTTQGISLFMLLPIEGEPHQVFNMMHNAARKIADEFNGQIYDAKRVLLTKQSLQQYVEKIREFERKRMLKR